MHLEPTFWVLVLATAVGPRLAPVRKTTAFGLANVAGLGLLVGEKAAVAGLAIAALLWLLLWAATAGPGGVRWAARRLAYLVPVAVFFAYKAAADWAGARTWLAAAEPLPR